MFVRMNTDDCVIDTATATALFGERKIFDYQCENVHCKLYFFPEISHSHAHTHTQIKRMSHDFVRSFFLFLRIKMKFLCCFAFFWKWF